jgi:uncharacterized protein
LKILFYFGHPSQYLFLRYTIDILREGGVECVMVIKSKDVLEDLLREDKVPYVNILPEGRKPGKIGIMTGLFKRDVRLWRFVRKQKFDLFIGTDPSLSHVGRLRRIPVITVLEDDIDVVPLLARITFPFTTTILTPAGCRTGRFERKTIHYDGYMKLAYLHPNQFKKSPAKLKQPYFLIRASKLDAYHDDGIQGFNTKIITKIIEVLQPLGSVYVSAEGSLTDSIKPFELRINPSEMQQVLANASMLISDSQSMSMEAAMLGVPSVRFSDFAGKISVLEELEHKYGLTFGIPTNAPEKLFDKLNELLAEAEPGQKFALRRERMLSDKIDVTAFMVWVIENYPKSAAEMKHNPDIQLKFKV